MQQSIGLIGGLGWESTVLYYQIINREVNRRLGGLHSASISIQSLDFEQIAVLQRAGDWEAMSGIMSAAACRLREAGARCIVIASNTMHRVASEVHLASQLPLLHIADTTAEAILRTSIRTVGLIGTRMTMEQSFYIEHLARYGIRCLIPEPDERAEVHRIIFGELFLGQFNEGSRARLRMVITHLIDQGARGIVLGCTELPLLVKAADSAVPLFDTAAHHAAAAVDFSLSGKLPRILSCGAL